MKWLLGLLTANLALLAYFSLGMPSAVELRIDEPPLNPEGIRLLAAEEIEALPRRAAAASVPVQEFACYEWGTFPRTSLASAQSHLSRLALESRVIEHTPQEATRYWVYIPNVGSMQRAQAHMDELRALGVTDMVVVQDQRSANVISLGVFKDEQLATKLLEDLRSKGVSNAVKGVRNQERGRSSLYISNMPLTLVPELESLQVEFPGSELKRVTCQ
ncbi:MAG TPA: SPOR domain-containing protein [Methylophilaceae bacterium]|jgi:hypothetical protein